MSDAFSRVPVKTINDGDVVVKLSDGTDVASVSAAGGLSVEVTAALPAGTNNIGDVDVASIASGDNTIGRVKLTDGTDTVAVNADGSLNTAVTSPLPAGTNLIGNVKLTDGTDDVAVNADGSLNVAVTSALPAGNNNIGDVDVASIAAGDNLVGRVKLSDGTDVAAITAAGAVSVDLTTVNGSAHSVSNPVFVSVVDNGVGAERADYAASSNVAANGGTQTIEFDIITGATSGSVTNLIVSSTVAMKWVLEAFDGGSATTVAVIITDGNETRTVDLDRVGRVFKVYGDGIAARFRLQLTNLDKNDTAAGYATLSWSEE